MVTRLCKTSREDHDYIVENSQIICWLYWNQRFKVLTGLVWVSLLVEQLLGWWLVNHKRLLGNLIRITVLMRPHFFLSAIIRILELGAISHQAMLLIFKTRHSWTSSFLPRGHNFELKLCSFILRCHAWMQMSVNMYVSRRCCILSCCRCFQTFGLVGSNLDSY